jgi:cytochrome c2
MRVFENVILKKYSNQRGMKKQREWRKWHNEKLHKFYASPNIISQIKSSRMRWAGHVARMGEERIVCKVLVGKPEGKSPLGRPRSS